MISLGDDDDAPEAEFVSGAEDALGRGQAHGIGQDPFGADAGAQGGFPHGSHLVVIWASAVAAHQKEGGTAAPVRIDARTDPVGQHGSGRPVPLHTAAQHEDGVGPGGRGRVSGGQDPSHRRFRGHAVQDQSETADEKEQSKDQKNNDFPGTFFAVHGGSFPAADHSERLRKTAPLYHPAAGKARGRAVAAERAVTLQPVPYVL